jgi:hypothetical protein
MATEDLQLDLNIQAVTLAAKGQADTARLLDKAEKAIYALEAALSASKAQSAQLAAALEYYAEKSNWTREARWTYETGRINAGGIEEEASAHVDLDTECVWNGEGDNGWEKADTALAAWQQANKGE